MRAALAATVLLLHVVAIGLLPRAPGPGTPRMGTPALQVRQIVAVVAAPSSAETVAPSTPEAVAVPRRLAPRQPPQPVPPSRQASPLLAPVAVVAPAQAAWAATVATVEAPAAATTALADPGGLSVPVYPTRLPPSAVLQYALTRGTRQGQAVLRWESDGDTYALSLQNEGLGAQALGSVSRGHVGPHGLAPDRHTENRRGRELRAVNFQYDSARITFSGPGIEYPLLPGAQDRLSWMLQLSAIAEASPALHTPGSEIAVFVAGSRGDGEVWRFTVLDRDAVALPAGAVAASLHLLREPRRPYDTQAEVWLDPARAHLPVRVRLVVRPTGEATEYLLQSAGPP